MILVVGVLILLIVGLIYRYNTINDDDIYTTVDPSLFETEKEVKANTPNDYLKSLEGYEETEVKVDTKKEKESSKNVVEVKTEATEEDISSEIDKAIDTAKKIDSYVDNLEQYDDSKKQNSSSETVLEEEKEIQTIQKGTDPMSDIVNDIDSIVDTVEN